MTKTFGCFFCQNCSGNLFHSDDSSNGKNQDCRTKGWDARPETPKIQALPKLGCISLEKTCRHWALLQTITAHFEQSSLTILQKWKILWLQTYSIFVHFFLIHLIFYAHFSKILARLGLGLGLFWLGQLGNISFRKMYPTHI